MNSIYLLHYSNDCGSIEYVVFSENCTVEALAEHARGDATCTNILTVSETGSRSSNVNYLRLDVAHRRENSR